MLYYIIIILHINILIYYIILSIIYINLTDTVYFILQYLTSTGSAMKQSLK